MGFGFKARSNEPVVAGTFVWFEQRHLRDEPYVGRVMFADRSSDGARPGVWATLSCELGIRHVHHHYVLRRATSLEVLSSGLCV